MSDTDESLVMVDNVNTGSMINDDTSSDEPELIQEGGGTAGDNSTGNTKKEKEDYEATTTTTKTATSTSAGSNDIDNNDNGNQHPRAIQIVSIGTADDPYAFVFDSAAVQTIMAQIPSPLDKNDCEIAIVSVVGAFRTGKSFLLSWFIHYLRFLQEDAGSSTTGTGDDVNDSSNNNNKRWYEQLDTIGNSGFHWQAGSDRNTTGIWMWSQPYVIGTNSINDKKKIVLLIDTQGMFDHETTMTLTTNIFGFSTLLSSYQIYNVDKRIQEDHLQQLALFSEYARLMTTIDTNEAASSAAENENHDEKCEKETTSDDSKGQKEAGTNVTVDPKEAPLSQPAIVTTTKAMTSPSDVVPKTKPFQKIEFLVRDWQHFEDDVDDNDASTINYDAIADSMMKYLQKVLAERDAKDLQDTREQILSCFDTISCFGLCHPGIGVTKKKFTGSIHDIEPLFVQLVAKYCETVFHPNHVPSKTIHGRIITADQFGEYIQAYAKIFTESLSSSSTTGKVNFPTATTMLEATASANNTNALRMAYSNYKNAMDRIAGPYASNFVSTDEFTMEHETHIHQSFRIFDSMANFGSSKSIKSTREQLIHDLSSSFETYKTMNDGRNPLAGVEIYFFPVLVAAVSYVFRWITDMTCSAKICRATAELLSHVYIVVFLFLCIIAATKAQQIKALCNRIFSTVQVMMNTDSSKNHPSSSSIKKMKNE